MSDFNKGGKTQGTQGTQSTQGQAGKGTQNTNPNLNRPTAGTGTQNTRPGSTTNTNIGANKGQQQGGMKTGGSQTTDKRDKR